MALNFRFGAKLPQRENYLGDRFEGSISVTSVTQQIDGFMSAKHIISWYSCLLCKTDVSVIFLFYFIFWQDVQSTNGFLYEVFILRSAELDKLCTICNCIY